LALQDGIHLNFLKHFFARYKEWFLTLVAPLGGPWAVFVIALMDAAALGIPLDPIVAYYVHTDPRRSILYAVMGAVGSALGSTVPYMIGYRGGEALVVKRVGRERFEKIHNYTEKYGDWALIVPCLLPPGFPFKLCVLSAGVAEMGYIHFLLSIFCGRLMRFLLLAGLTIKFGPEVVALMGALVKHHLKETLIVVAVLVALGLLLKKYMQRSHAQQAAAL
jgi:membrane protein YqaA with SNARE-associated domain